ncbi:MAG: HIT domain-containing protein [Aquisalinus sp.]|nr:HIT domain-containing protein [Aquisalinus sp.]
MDGFLLDPQIEADTIEIGALGLCRVRLMNDSRFPWLVLVPQRPEVTEIFDLSEEDRDLCFKEITLVSRALKQQTGCDKINIAAFGNMVAQLHIHIIARFRDDPAWPGSAIGLAGGAPYSDDAARAIVEKLSQDISVTL